MREKPDEIKKYLLSPYQKNIMDILLAYPDTAIGNIGGLVIWNERIPFNIIEKSFISLLQCHPVLLFQMQEDYTMYEAKMQENIITYIDAKDKSIEEVKQMAQECLEEKFVLFHHPLFEFRYFDMGESCIVLVKEHHLISDGASITASLQHVESVISTLLKGDVPLQEKERVCLGHLEDDDYMSAAAREKAKNYFKEMLSQKEIVWKLKENILDPKAKRMMYSFPESLAKKIEDICSKESITPEQILYAAFYLYVSRQKNCEEVIMGRVMVNRSKKDLPAVGLFANILPLLIKEPEDSSFLSLCREIKKECWRLQRYRAYSYHQMAENCKIKESVFDISISYRNKRLMPVGIKSRAEELFNGWSETPLRIFLNEEEKGMAMEVQYQTGCYNEREIGQMIERIYWVIEQGILGVGFLPDISILSPQDEKLVKQFNTTMHLSFERPVIDMVLLQCKKTSDKVALMFQDKKVSYQELEERVFKTAEYLQKKVGVKRGEIIGICLERNERLPILLLGIWKAGAAFVTISPFESKERKETIAAQCDYWAEKEEIRAISKKGAEKGASLRENGRNKMAYYMYTSGSTGEPKAVGISARSLTVRLQWMLKEYGCGDRVLQKTNITFDVSVWELFLPLISGNTLCLLDQGDERFPDRIGEAIIKYNISMLHFVPSMLQGFIEDSIQNQMTYPKVRQIICSGEVLTRGMVKEAYQIFPNGIVYNFYGPTECTIDVSHCICREKEEISIGRPVANTELYVVNEKRQCLPPGIEGELCITGDLVGEGYYRNGQWVESDVFGTFRGKRAYFTGDYVRLLEDGNLQYIGRRDRQYKRYGMRIDLNAIEEELKAQEGVTQAAVLIQGNQLTAFYTGKKEVEVAVLKERLSEKLPYYNIPSQIIYIDHMPLTKNGKRDSKVLAEMRKVKRHETEIPKNEIEKQLVLSVGKYMGIENISVTVNLLEEGLDSLLILQIVMQLKRQGFTLEYQDFYEKNTIRLLAELEKKRREMQKKEMPEKSEAVEKNKKEMNWFKQDGNGTLVFGIPYAGGTVHTFWNLHRICGTEPWDMAAISTDYFSKYKVEDIASEMAKILIGENYHRYVILGCCVGTGIAMEIADRLEKAGGMVILILAASLPQKGLRIGKSYLSYWDIMTDSMMEHVLKRMYHTKVEFPKGMIRAFRGDIRRYLCYQDGITKKCIQGNVYLIFAEKDSYTRGYRKKKKKWEILLGKTEEIPCFELADAGHFFIQEEPEKVKDILSEIIKKEGV